MPPDPGSLDKRLHGLQLSIEGILKLAGDDSGRFWEIWKGITTPRELLLLESQLAVVESMAKNLKTSLKTINAAAEGINAKAGS
ncbi:MAG: hypothetical protein ACOYEV_01230 [Candidatus Nanopelagicales bacterium]